VRRPSRAKRGYHVPVPPTPQARRSLRKAVHSVDHMAAIRDAVQRVHRCTLLATELLNLYVRDRLENHDASGLDKIFDSNWPLNAYYLVSSSKRAGKTDTLLKAVFDAHIEDSFVLQNRAGQRSVPGA
tara:strand:+ start:2686 stop:3069 length:384 start_codon:yes stop_codon:yes gene_type:complete